MVSIPGTAAGPGTVFVQSSVVFDDTVTFSKGSDVTFIGPLLPRGGITANGPVNSSGPVVLNQPIMAGNTTLTNNTYAGTTTVSPSATLSVEGLTTRYLQGPAAAVPTITLGPGFSPGSTITSFTGHDTAGNFTVSIPTTSTVPANSTLFTITFSQALAAAPSIFFLTIVYNTNTLGGYYIPETLTAGSASFISSGGTSFNNGTVNIYYAFLL